jgi:hypothetical protein
MTRIQIRFPDPLCQRLKEIAGQREWSAPEVMRKVAEQFVRRFPEEQMPRAKWRFPTLDCGGDFFTDPATIRLEADSIEYAGKQAVRIC